MLSEQYIAWTDTTAVYPGINTGNHAEVSYLSLGLVGETIEFMEKVHEAQVAPSSKEDLIAELGDIVWYAMRLAKMLGQHPDMIDHIIVESNLPVLSQSDRMYYLHRMVIRAGKIAELGKKIIRDTDKWQGEVMQEHLVGFFAIWGLNCRGLKVQPSEVMQANVTKLESRKARGKLQGSGDSR